MIDKACLNFAAFAMATAAGDVPLEPEEIRAQERALADAGYRVLAIADGTLSLTPRESFSREHLSGLTLLGLAEIGRAHV